jgi:hypothetical protein
MSTSSNNNKHGYQHQYGYPLPRPLQLHKTFVDTGVGHGQEYYRNPSQHPPRPPAPTGANCQQGVCTPSSRYPCGFKNFH